jgi:hypothetical protein
LNARTTGCSQISWANEFNDITKFLQEDVEKWLIHHVNKNEDQVDINYQLGFELKDIEDELFDLNINHELMVAPLQEYIEQWLYNALVRITDPESQETITTVRTTPTKQNIKKTSTSK